MSATTAAATRKQRTKSTPAYLLQQWLDQEIRSDVDQIECLLSGVDRHYRVRKTTGIDDLARVRQLTSIHPKDQLASCDFVAVQTQARQRVCFKDKKQQTRRNGHARFGQICAKKEAVDKRARKSLTSIVHHQVFDDGRASANHRLVHVHRTVDRLQRYHDSITARHDRREPRVSCAPPLTL